MEQDLYVQDADELQALYNQYFTLLRPETVVANAEIQPRSTVLCKDGFDRTWNVAQKLNLTYCYGPFQNTSLLNAVRASVPRALRQYERVADVNFILIDVDEDTCMTTPEIRYKIRQGTSADCTFLGKNPSGTGEDCLYGFANAIGATTAGNPSVLMCPFNNNPWETEAEELASIMRCAEDCVEEGERSLEIDRRCAAAHERFISCLAPLSCDEFWEWGTKSSPGYPCDDTERDFFAECPGIREDL